MELNLPKGDFKIKNINNIRSIYDIVRGKYVALTPEEWVRQNFVSFLVNSLGYPMSLIGNEISLVQNGISRRCDTLVANRNGNPLMIVEYKAPHIEITQKVFDQITRYNYVLHARYIVVSNGMQHYCCRIDYENRKITFIPDIPRYDELEQ